MKLPLFGFFFGGLFESLNNKFSSGLMLVFSLQLVLVSGSSAQNPSLPPSDNFDLNRWKITLPNKSEIKEQALSNGYESTNEFYTNPMTGAMVFRCRNDGVSTSNSSYARSELREMLRSGKTSISTTGIGLNNWVFSNSSLSNQNASGGVDGTLTATVVVNHVSTTGESDKIGRVVIGQIHASDDEPCRLYYRKLPGNDKGVIYFAHEPNDGFGSEQWHEMIGSRSNSASNPSDGIALGEKFSYRIDVLGSTLTVTIVRFGKPDVQKTVDMSTSGLADDWMYFKAGVYNQNNTGDAGDYCEVSFYELNVSHSTADNFAPITSVSAPSNGSIFNEGDDIVISADASDSDGSINRVEFWHGATLLGEDTSSPYSFSWTDVPGGSYYLYAKAIDDEGAVANSWSVNVDVEGNVLGSNSLNNLEIKKNELMIFPNRVSLSASFEYELSKAAHVELSVYNVSGLKIATLINSSQNSGTQKVLWSPPNHLRRGIYLAKLRVGRKIMTARMILD